MGLFGKNSDFIAPKEELKETLGSSMKELLDGRILADKVIRKNIRFILFLMALGIIYITNGYRAEKLHKTRVRLEREVRDARFKSITAASELMFISKQSEVKRRVQEEGLNLQESKEPPVKLYR